MSKVRNLPEITTLSDDDLFYVVYASEGVNGGRKIRKDNIQVTAEAHALSHKPGGTDALAVDSPVTVNANGNNDEGIAEAFSRADHKHNISTGTPISQTPDQANAQGAASSLSRSDHTHNIPTAAPSSVGTVNSQGVASAFSRADHVHNHGVQTDGSLHAAATASVNGFMSAADKARFDTMVFGFLSYSNASNQSTTQDNTAYTPLTLTTDNGSLPNGLVTKTSTTQFRADFTGFVRISYKILAQNISTNDKAWRVAISKNGTVIPETENRSIGKTNANRFNGASGTFLIACATNDLFTLGFGNAETTTDTITAYANGVNFSIKAIYKSGV